MFLYFDPQKFSKDYGRNIEMLEYGIAQSIIKRHLGEMIITTPESGGIEISIGIPANLMSNTIENNKN